MSTSHNYSIDSHLENLLPNRISCQIDQEILDSVILWGFVNWYYQTNIIWLPIHKFYNLFSEFIVFAWKYETMVTMKCNAKNDLRMVLQSTAIEKLPSNEIFSVIKQWILETQNYDVTKDNQFYQRLFVIVLDLQSKFLCILSSPPKIKRFLKLKNLKPWKLPTTSNSIFGKFHTFLISWLRSKHTNCKFWAFIIIIISCWCMCNFSRSFLLQNRLHC